MMVALAIPPPSRSGKDRSQPSMHFWLSWDSVATDVAQQSQTLAFQTRSAMMADARYQ